MLKDERTLVVEGGVIKEIKEKETPKDDGKEADKGAGADDEFAQAVMEGFNTLAEKIAAIEKRFARIEKTQSKFEVEDEGSVSNATAEGSKKKFSIDDIKARKESYKK